MDIKQYIQLEKLDTNNRKRELVYKRFYMFAYLRKTYGFSLERIGRLFSKHHATIIHGINEYEYFKEDKLFQEITEEIRQDFPMGVIPKNDLLSSMYQILGQQNKFINRKINKNGKRPTLF